MVIFPVPRAPTFIGRVGALRRPDAAARRPYPEHVIYEYFFRQFLRIGAQ
jgi:hypothetical protein